MSQHSALSLLDTAIKAQLDAEEIDVRVLKQIRWQLSKIPDMYKRIDNVVNLAETCLQYIELIIRFTDTSDTLNGLSFALSRVEVFKYFNPLLEIGQMPGLGNDFLVTSANQILERIVNDPSLKNLCVKGILHYLTVIIRNADSSAQRAIEKSRIFLYKLADMLTACGDYEYQMFILEVIIRMASRESINSSANDFFPDAESLQHALVMIDRHQFDRSSRVFLNTVNAIYGNVFSMVADKVFLDKTAVSGASLESRNVRQKLWVDFNKKVGTIGIYCDRDSLRTAPPSEDSNPATCFGWELITICCADIKDIHVKRLGNNRSTTMFQFEMRQQLHVLFASSEPLTHSKYVTLWVSSEKDAQKLQSEILPELFPAKYSRPAPSVCRSVVELRHHVNLKKKTSKSVKSDSRSMKSLLDFVTVSAPRRSVGKNIPTRSECSERSERSVRQLSPDSTVPEAKPDLFEASSTTVHEECYKQERVAQTIKLKNHRYSASYFVDTETRQDSTSTENKATENEEESSKSVLQEIDLPLSQKLTQEIDDNVRSLSDKENVGFRVLRSTTESGKENRRNTADRKYADPELPKKQTQIAGNKALQTIVSTESDSDVVDLQEIYDNVRSVSDKDGDKENVGFRVLRSTTERGKENRRYVADRKCADLELPKKQIAGNKALRTIVSMESDSDLVDSQEIEDNVRSLSYKENVGFRVLRSTTESGKENRRTVADRKYADPELPKKQKEIAQKQVSKRQAMVSTESDSDVVNSTPTEKRMEKLFLNESSKTQTSSPLPGSPKTTQEVLDILRNTPEEKIVEKPEEEPKKYVVKLDEIVPIPEPSKKQPKKKKIAPEEPEETTEDFRSPEETIVAKRQAGEPKKYVVKLDEIDPIAEPSKKQPRKKKIAPEKPEETTEDFLRSPEETIVAKPLDGEPKKYVAKLDEIDPMPEHLKKQPKKKKMAPEKPEETTEDFLRSPEETIVEKPQDGEPKKYVVKLDEIDPMPEPLKKQPKKKIAPETTEDFLRSPEETIVEKPQDREPKKYVAKLDEIDPMPEPLKKQPKKKKTAPEKPEETTEDFLRSPEETIVEKPQDGERKKYVVKLDEIFGVMEPPKKPKEKVAPPVRHPIFFEDLSKTSVVDEEQDLSALYLSRLKDLEPEIPRSKTEVLLEGGAKEEPKKRGKPKKRFLYQPPKELEVVSPDNTIDVHEKSTKTTDVAEKPPGAKTRTRKATQETKLVDPKTSGKSTEQPPEVPKVPVSVEDKKKVAHETADVTLHVHEKSIKQLNVVAPEDTNPGGDCETSTEVLDVVEETTKVPKTRKRKVVQETKTVEEKSTGQPKVLAPEVQETEDVNLDERSPERTEEVIAKSPFKIRFYDESESRSSDEGPRISVTTVADVHRFDTREIEKLLECSQQFPKRQVPYRLFKLSNHDIEFADEAKERTKDDGQMEKTKMDYDVNDTLAVAEQQPRTTQQLDSPEPEPRKKRKYTRRADKKKDTIKGKKPDKLDSASLLCDETFQQYLQEQEERCPEKRIRKRAQRRLKFDNDYVQLQHGIVSPLYCRFDPSDDDLPENKARTNFHDLEEVRSAESSNRKSRDAETTRLDDMLAKSKRKAQRKSTLRTDKKTYPLKSKARLDKKPSADEASRLFDEMMAEGLREDVPKKVNTFTSNLTLEKSRLSDAVARLGENREDSLRLSLTSVKNRFSSESEDLPELEIEAVRKKVLTPSFLRSAFDSSDQGGVSSSPDNDAVRVAPPLPPTCDDTETIPAVMDTVTMLKRKNDDTVCDSPPKRAKINILQNIMLKAADNTANGNDEKWYMLCRNVLQNIGDNVKFVNHMYENLVADERYRRDVNLTKSLVREYKAYGESSVSQPKK